MNRSELKKIKRVPIEGMVVEEQDASEFASGIEVSPIDSGATIAGIEDERLERRVERS